MRRSPASNRTRVWISEAVAVPLTNESEPAAKPSARSGARNPAREETSADRNDIEITFQPFAPDSSSRAPFGGA